MMARLALVALLAGWPATHAATVPALFSAGNAAFASGQYEQAIDFYSQALDLGEAPPAVYYNLGCALFAAKDWEKQYLRLNAPSSTVPVSRT
ncbi:tetratricopeptide repeat protein [bacterium]|nr:tetratricopeptide repeat protein [bacterium]